MKSTLNNTDVTRYIYDSKENLTQKIYPDQYNPDYDGLNASVPVNTYSNQNVAVSVGDRYTYDPSGNVTQHIDSENNSTSYIYDADNKVEKSVYNNTQITRYLYDPSGNLIQQINPDQYVAADDGLNDPTTPTDTYSDPNAGDRYTYDSNGNMLTHTDPGNKATSYTYDSNNNMVTSTQPDGSVFTYNSTGSIVTEQYPNGVTNTSQYNSDGTRSSVTGNNGFSTQYGYDSNQNVIKFTQTLGSNVNSLAYTYDSHGNILTISQNGTQEVQYYYDANNELTREDNVWQNETITYSYDSDGNITAKNIYTATAAGDLTSDTPINTYTYTYDQTNKDQLDNYSGNAISAITYDSNGNMQTYNGWTYSWQKTDQLAGMSNTGNTISYQYNDNGIRTSKTVNGVTTNYTLNGNQIVSQSDGTNTINYTYDSNGNLVYMTLNGTVYYYEKDNQGDITGLVDSNGNEVVTYSYDSWGNLLGIGGSLASTVGALNPFRYRGYYYDTETSMYYLQSRYYNPELGRFISKDDPSNSQSTNNIEDNLYDYCDNNPVMNYDIDGHSLTKSQELANYNIYLSKVEKSLNISLNRPISATLINNWDIKLTLKASVVIDTNSEAPISISHDTISAQAFESEGFKAGITVWKPGIFFERQLSSYCYGDMSYGIDWLNESLTMTLITYDRYSNISEETEIEMETNIIEYRSAVFYFAYPNMGPEFVGGIVVAGGVLGKIIYEAFQLLQEYGTSVYA